MSDTNVMNEMTKPLSELFAEAVEWKLSDHSNEKRDDFGRYIKTEYFLSEERLTPVLAEVGKHLDRMNTLGQALPPNAISMEIQKSLSSLRRALEGM